MQSLTLLGTQMCCLFENICGLQKKRRFAPHFVVPLELWLMCLFPNRRFACMKSKGVGFVQTKVSTNAFFRCLSFLFRRIRLTQSTPLVWHRSHGCQLAKGNTLGCDGVRLVFAFESKALILFLRHIMRCMWTTTPVRWLGPL